MKRSGMLFISVRGINQGFWSHLGFHDETELFSAVKVSFRVQLKK